MCALVSTKHNQYKPSFNEKDGKYYDECPYLPYQRNRQTYKCACKSGFTFCSSAEFNQHIKSLTHKKWLNEYKDESVEDGEIKELRIMIGQLENRNRILTRKFKKLYESHTNISSKLSDKETTILELTSKLVKTRNENKCIKEENEKLIKQFKELDEEEEKICNSDNFSDLGDSGSEGDVECYDYEYEDDIYYVDKDNNVLDPEEVNKNGRHKIIGKLVNGIPFINIQRA